MTSNEQSLKEETGEAKIEAFVSYGPLRSYDHEKLMDRVLGPALESLEEVRDTRGNLTGWNIVISTLETPPLHKEGEAAATDRAMRGDEPCGWPECGCDFDAKCSDAPAPVPVPLEDGQVEIIEQSDTPDGGTALTLRQYDQETVVVAYFPPVLPPASAPVPVRITDEAFENHQWPLGQRVTKTKGSSWTGKVVGFYSTALTPVGYAVESENEPGSVQIYPEAALSVKPGEQG